MVNDMLTGYPLSNWSKLGCFTALLLFLLLLLVIQVAGASPASIRIEPSYQIAPQGENVTVAISIDPSTNEVAGAQYELYFNTSILNAITQTPGPFLSQDGVTTTVLLNSIDNTLGKVAYGEFRTGVDYGITNPGTLASVTFHVIAESGISTLNFSKVLLSTPFAEEIETDCENGTVEVGVPPPYLVTANVSNATISPNGDHHFDCTELRLVFSKPVAATVAIEDPDHQIIKELYSSDSVVDPGQILWYGECSNGSTVPDGTYFINITMDDRVNPLLYNNTMTLIVDTTPPSPSNATPALFIGEIAPLISVDVTDVSNIDEDSLKLYIEGLHVLSQKTKLDNGYRVSYQTEQPYSNEERITVRLIARDTVWNRLDFSWNFSVDGEPPEYSNQSPTGFIKNPLPRIVVTITDEHGVDPTSIKLYVKGYRVTSELEEIANGFRVSYQTEYPFQDQEIISVRILANDTAHNTLEYSWDFSVATVPFDTGSGTYPSISGVYKGNITPKYNVVVDRLYTYPCAGSGGHTEFVRIRGAGIDVNATWNGYCGDYHNITFPYQFTLLANHTYTYTIKTGSYPKIHHTSELTTDRGTITCTEFTDANGRSYNNWIPAIRLE